MLNYLSKPEVDDVIEAVSASGGTLGRVSDHQDGRWTVSLKSVPDMETFLRALKHRNPHTTVSLDYMGLAFNFGKESETPPQ